MLFKNISYFSPDGKLIKNAFIEIRDKKIYSISFTEPKGYKGEVIDGENKLLLPGFVNTHCHVPMVLMRGLGGSLSLQDWLTKAIFPTEAKLSADDVYYGTLLGIGEMLKSGVTSFSDMYYFSERIAEASIESGISANIALEGFAFDPLLGNKFSIEKDRLIDFHKSFNGLDNGRINVDMTIHAEYTTTEKRCQMLSEIAQELNSNVQLHLSETKSETEGCIKKRNMTPTEYFDSIGVFKNKVTAAHCVYLTENDMDILKENNVSVAHCPVSNLKLASGIADITKMDSKGINVTIGTDGAASNDNLNILEELKLSSILQKAKYGDASLMAPSKIINMASLNGALSQNRHNTGKIEEEYYADLVVIDFSKSNMTPAGDMLNTFLYSAMTENIYMTICRGKVVYKNGVLLTIDEEKAKYEVNKRSLNII